MPHASLKYMSKRKLTPDDDKSNLNIIIIIIKCGNQSPQSEFFILKSYEDMNGFYKKESHNCKITSMHH